MSPRRVLPLLLLALIPTSAALAATQTTVRTRAGLTARETLRGDVRFRTPAAWDTDPKSGVYTARFTREAASGCEVRLNASIRGKATTRSPAGQVTDAVGTAPLARGTRSGGRYGLRETAGADGGEGVLYGIAVIRAAPRRYGQLRVFAAFAGTGCSAEVRRGATADEVERVLRTARSWLRVSRSS